MGYGGNFFDAYRETGSYAARILKGEKPHDLPVLHGTKVELFINRKAVEALGLKIPNRLGGRVPTACDLPVGRVSEGRRPHVLRTVPQRRLSSHCATANLPVEQPSRFELVINLKTAGVLDLAISPTLLARADEVIGQS
jgi:ABC-type uncharacterized transport system substrate-binding protein